MRTHLLITSAALALLATGCGDVNSSSGQLGRLNYSLHSDFLVDGAALVGTSILTGHPQTIRVELTDSGEDDTSNPEDIEHRAVPSEGVTVETWESSSDVGSMTITVTTPGDYVIESVLDGNVFDWLTLTFDSPTSMELVTWIRPPNGEDFDQTNGSPIFTDEGAQAAFVPIPLDAGGDRIAGDFVPVITADPEWAVVTGVNVLGIYEQNVVVARSPASVYFIEPGEISVTVTDDVNGVDGVAVFDVAPVNVPVGR